jgi:hypothetical protein
MRYSKDNTSRFTVKFVREENNEIILEVPTTPMELLDYFKTDYVYKVMKNTFGEAKLESIGNVIVLVDQKYIVD